MFVVEDVSLIEIVKNFSPKCFEKECAQSDARGRYICSKPTYLVRSHNIQSVIRIKVPTNFL